MQRLIILFGMLLIKVDAMCQDTSLFKNDIGLKIASSNLRSLFNRSSFDEPTAQFIDGLFLRIGRKRFAFRAEIDVSKNQGSSFYGPTSFFSKVHIESKFDFKIAAGTQYCFLRKRNIYVFTDLYYRKRWASGTVSDDKQILESTFSMESYYLGLNSGLGIKIKITKDFFISPEVFCDVFYFNTTSVYHEVKPIAENRFTYFGKHAVSAARVFLTIGF